MSAKRILSRSEVALKPRYATKEPNQRVLLYEGPLLISDSDPGKPGQIRAPDGKVYLRWIHSPGVEFEATGGRELGLVTNGVVTLANLKWQAPFFTTRRSTEAQAGGANVERLCGHVTKALEGFYPRARTQNVSEILFHVANADWLPGTSVIDGRVERRDRIQLEAGAWRVTLEAVSDHSDHFTKLKWQGGYSLTYVGLLERIDGGRFAPESITSIQDTLYWFLSFLWARRTGPVLLVGRVKGKAVWERWSVPKLDPWAPAESWAPRGDPSMLTQLFSGLFKKLNDSQWERTIRIAIHWYMAAVSQAGAIEGAIMMSQTAFELLWWTEFVAVNLAVHEPERIIAADKLRLLLERHRIPMAIPADLSQLAKEAHSKDWDDGPQAITQVRNGIVHPARGRKPRAPLAHPPVGEAWRLSLWYLELCLLAILEYDGPYCSRIPAGGYANDTMKVPWA